MSFGQACDDDTEPGQATQPEPRQAIDGYRRRVEEALAERLPAENSAPAALHQAMRYAVLGGGKRVRPVLVYASGHAVGAPTGWLDGAACAVECIHAYSLVHDDLPAMDNDDLRRGRPTCHRAFDEATAILAGDALQALAFQLLADDCGTPPGARQRLRMIALVAQACGSRGMAGGQAMDLAAIGRHLNLPQLEQMHIHKTGALIRASVLLGAHAAENTAAPVLEALDHYAKCIGLAFQIQDDILDVVGDSAETGKRQGADEARHKPTYVSLLGLSEAKDRARDLCADAVRSLEILDERAEALRWLAGFIVDRGH